MSRIRGSTQCSCKRGEGHNVVCGICVIHYVHDGKTLKELRSGLKKTDVTDLFRDSGD